MANRFFILFLFIFSSLAAQAQSWDSIKNDHTNYISGEGWGETLDEADKQALAAIISQISIAVSNNYEQLEGEKIAGGEQEYKRYVENKISTFSSATLTNTESLILSNEPEAHVARWIKKSEINKIFEGRKAKIKEFVGNAIAAEKKLKIDDALRNLYWAYSMLKTLQYPSEVTYSDNKGESHLLFSWIPVKMEELLEGIKPSVIARNDNELELYFSYEGKPVTSLDYTYFDGSRWSNIYSAKDGKGVLELAPGAPVDNIQIKYEYAYRNEAHIDKELYSVINVVKGNAMKASYCTLKGNVEKSVAASVRKNDEQVSKNTVCSLEKLNDDKLVTANMNKVIEAIRTKNYKSVDHLFTDDGLDMYHRLISYGNASLVGNPTFSVYKNGDRAVVRSVPMSFSFKRGVRKSFVEDIVFTFNPEGKIECLAFCLDAQATLDILNKQDWPANARMSIIEFLENYKTAFALERLDYIRTIFDDDAVIIVGKVARVANNYSSDSQKLGPSKIFTTVKYTKTQYLKQLERCFASNEFVNIRFANNDVLKAGKGGEIYGIQIKQDYYSTTYGDSGYLFLLVDINNPQEPTIKVRTWQPEPDPVNGLFDMSIF